MSSKVLVISAAMGAGHVGASRELARRVEERGHRAVVVDFLDAFPARAGVAWKAFYLLQLRRFPESYESTYRLFYEHERLWAPFVAFETALAQRRVLRWLRDEQPDVVVSTYSFATLVLGELKERGQVRVPTVNFLTDFAVHPRSVHPGIDLNLAIHPAPAAEAARRTQQPSRAPGPLVAPAFTRDRGARQAVRDELGVGDQPLVLLTSGSWGVGANVTDTVDAITRTGRYQVVTMCGTDERLRRTLEARRLGIAMGWTNRMPELLAAADVVVENAGGLTSLEAFASGLPIVTYRPIPGHGRDNAAQMAKAGVTHLAADEADLVDAIDRLSRPGPDRDAQLAATSALFVSDPAEDVVALLDPSLAASRHGGAGKRSR
jgi:UDP-N-acetylglucosamine:LPS N-acetylglucosamine transferase